MGACASMTQSTTEGKFAATTDELNATSASSALVKLVGASLVSASGNVETSSALGSGKTVGLYFSAHWCPPCRAFTPKLAQIYRDLKKAGKPFEIIFISSDRDQAAFESYFREMPWLALPFSDRKTKNDLSQKYGVSGIPTLVLLNADGNLITKDGRSKVISEPTGNWISAAPRHVATKMASAKTTPPTTGSSNGLSKLLGADPFLDVDGKTPIELSLVVQDAPLIALYFSAHWCGPCRAFTPKLVTFIDMLAEEGTKLPVIFGSGDQDEASFQEYFGSMPTFHAFPYGDGRINALKAKFEVSGIPWLVVLDADGNLIANEADNDVPKGLPAYQGWLEKAKAARMPAVGAPAA
jgi:nucleoredoxin